MGCVYDVLIITLGYGLFRALRLAGTTTDAGFFDEKAFQEIFSALFSNSIAALNSRISQEGHITFSPL